MAASPDDQGFVIDGKTYTADDLSFREQRELRKLIRELAEDPEAEIDQMALMDVVPAFVYVVMKRDNPELNIDSVLDMRLSDFVADDEKPAPPTRKARGTSGAQK